MRKTRFIVVAALIAVLGIAAAAYAQTNAYNVSAKVPSGGSKKKPKIGGFTFHFDVSDPAGNIPQVIQQYSLGIEGSQVNTKAAPVCAAAKINANRSDKGCSSKALVGTGSVKAIIGTQGDTMANKVGDCTLNLKIYNGGTNKAAVYLSSTTATCVTAISQAIDATWVKKDGGTALVFTVPEELRHQVGLDVPVVSTDAKFKTIKKTIGKGKKKKKIGYFESIGCKDRSRTATATFTDEKGTATPVTAELGKC